MAKRGAEDLDEQSGPSKRPKYDHGIYRLSDEILLRTFSFLPVPSICRCQRVSRHFSAISRDPQIWKEQYYDRFVRPRAARLRGQNEAWNGTVPDFSSKLSNWLDESNLVSRGQETDWKRQYRLRHNWARGRCRVSEIDVPDHPRSKRFLDIALNVDPPKKMTTQPNMLVRLHEGLLFTVEQASGIQVWSARGERRLLATLPFKDNKTAPTALAVDTRKKSASPSPIAQLAIGFRDGSFAVYAFIRDDQRLRRIYRHPASTNGMISAIAYSSPYILTMTSKQRLSLYRCSASKPLEPPVLLHSLTSQHVRGPLSLSLRRSGDKVLASVAYLVPTLSSGSIPGIQELTLSAAGKLERSRLATATGKVYHISPMPFSETESASDVQEAGREFTNAARDTLTSITYSHPYLLMSSWNNTLTLFLVKSTASYLSIGEGSQLWGHTSGVSGAHIGGRGKAVSVTYSGDELRVWELEGAFASQTLQRRLSVGQLSVRVRPAQREGERSLGALAHALSMRGDGLGLAHKETRREADIMKGWIGFDEESAVALKQRADGRQALVVYDFS